MVLITGGGNGSPSSGQTLSPSSPTAHRLEYLDLASSILKEPLNIEDGHALVSDGPGIGLEWDEKAVERYLVR
jgi:mandelate racemase